MKLAPPPAPDPAAAFDASRPWLAGSFAGAPFGEVLLLLGDSLRGGELALQLVPAAARRRKTLWLRDGQVIFAGSSDPSDALGPVLWRRGLVGRELLERLAPRVGPERPLGQVLVAERLLTPGALYEALVLQVREIVLGVFHEPAGTFVFRDGEPPAGATAVRLPERTRDLVAAGARRVAEVDALALEVPDPDRPLRRVGLAPRGIEERAARLLAAADGAVTAREAFARCGLGFYDGVKVLAALARAGLVDGPAAPRPGADPGPAVAAAAGDPSYGPIEAYRRIFKLVFFRVAHADLDARARLNSWFDRLGDEDRAAFEGVRLDETGELDAGRVLANVFAAGREEGPAARARALAALDAFLAFALFEASNLLPRADAESLAGEVARLQGRRAP